MNNSAKRKFERMGRGDLTKKCAENLSVKVQASALMKEAELRARNAVDLLRGGPNEVNDIVEGVQVVNVEKRDGILQQASSEKAASTRAKNDALKLIEKTRFSGLLSGEVVMVERAVAGYDDARTVLAGQGVESEKA